MLIKLGKSLLMAILILSLTGCGSLNKMQAKQIEEKLSEMYDGEKFEVLALGNRFGTLTNDTVTAFVKSKKTDVVFECQMNTKGKIVSSNYPGRAMNTQVENILNKNLADGGITADSLTFGFGVEDVSDLKPNMKLSDYISTYKPEYFSGYLVIKESNNNTGSALTKAFQESFEELQNTPLQANVWVIAEESYDEVISEFVKLPDVSNSWFKDKNTIGSFQFSVTAKGVNIDESKLNNLLKGGEWLDLY
ncbi:hypothetical protein NST89_06640 [Caldifermentibacillus hisashii]|uniref:hypothetical protein n=2 Tax=Caldifermentibacillus hisashii TaxID=996558 RepID=UPI003135B544